MAKDKPTKIATKKHLARLERERRQTRLITSIAIGIVVAIVGLIGYGILNETVLKARQPVVTVNGDSVTLREFQVRVRAMRQQYANQFLYYYQLYQMFGMDPASDSNLSQIETNLATPSNIGQQVIEEITNDLLIRQYAQDNGIVVTDAEIEKAIHDAFGYYPDGTPTPAATGTPLIYPTWSATQYALMTPIIPATLTPTPTIDLTATATTIPTLAPTGTATAIPSITPTATPYTQDGFQTTYKESLSIYAQLGMTEADFRRIFFESALYRERVTAIVTADVAREQEQVWARHILVTDEVTAQSIREQLLAGADFATLAAANSLDPGSKDAGGDLGWFGKGQMLAEFETATFALQVGEISQPVQTAAGWHIIQALGHETRPFTDTEYTDAVTAAFNQWLTDQRAIATIVIASNWVANTPNLPSLESISAATATAYANQALQQPVLTLTPTP